jgi:hypothetical protein
MMERHNELQKRNWRFLMSATALSMILAQLADFSRLHISADEIAERLGGVEYSPLARNLRVVHPANPAWVTAHVSVNDDGSVPWVSLEPAPALPLTVAELRDALGEPSPVLRVHWNVPEKVKFRYRHKDFSCLVFASLDDEVGSTDRRIVNIVIHPDQALAPRIAGDQ